MRKLIAANWKENPGSEKKALELFKEVAKGKRASADVVVCPPSVYFEEIAATFRKLNAKTKRNLAIGAQDVFWEEKGAFTSEVGPKMIRALGVRYVIVGHSERRKYLKETDEMINKKIKLALRDGLKVILCVGESLAIKKKGITAARDFVKNQLKKDLAGVKVGGKNVTKSQLGSLIVAYEPIWAIGTGRNDSPEDAVEMARFIKKILKNAAVLYGGSVNSKDAASYLRYNDIDGALVGGASLKAAEFEKIVSVVSQI